MKKFEVKILNTGMDPDIEVLNTEGKNGWEFVAVQQVGMGLNHYFKRELISDEKPEPKKEAAKAKGIKKSE